MRLKLLCLFCKKVRGICTAGRAAQFRRCIVKKSITKLIAELAQQLLVVCEEKSVAEQESWWLAEKLTQKTKTELLNEKELVLTNDAWHTLESWVAQRLERKPLQYILGNVPFCNLEILVEPPILIPRPETEEWTSWLFEKLGPIKNEPLKILDIGVGSGCIALALARALPYAQIIGVDSDLHAIQLSKKNQEHNKISNAIFLQSDLYQELAQHKQSFDLIVSNPPYIPEEEYRTLSKDVTDWENKQALVASDEGFAIHKKILVDAKKYLKLESILKTHKLPQLVLEFGVGQEVILEKLFTDMGFLTVTVHKDLENRPRWITGQLL